MTAGKYYELTNKYPLVNISEDYPDGCIIIFNQKQCEKLYDILHSYISNYPVSVIGTEDDNFEYLAWENELCNYLCSKKGY